MSQLSILILLLDRHLVISANSVLMSYDRLFARPKWLWVDCINPDVSTVVEGSGGV